MPSLDHPHHIHLLKVPVPTLRWLVNLEFVPFVAPLFMLPPFVLKELWIPFNLTLALHPIMVSKNVLHVVADIILPSSALNIIMLHRLLTEEEVMRHL